MKLAVVLFNLGGPDSLQSVEPFLRNLFSDPAILPLPRWLRMPAAAMIASRRAPVARAIYRQLGGRSPLLDETLAQAAGLELALSQRGASARVFVAMRAWKPTSEDAAHSVSLYAPEMIVLLPLYPQYSTTTSGSSLAAWRKAAAKAMLRARETRICCYPWDEGFIAALADQVHLALARRKQGLNYRILFSAHGLPQRIVSRGDPYQWQVEHSVEAVARQLDSAASDWKISYQSRVGPLKWLEPATEAEIRRAGSEGKGVIVVPVAFVSEHSETLVELDIDYARLARESGVPDYLRAGTVRTAENFIEGLASLVLKAMSSRGPVTCGEGRICPAALLHCGMRGNST